MSSSASDHFNNNNNYGGGDDHSTGASSSASSRRANLFSKWRHRSDGGVGAAGGGVGGVSGGKHGISSISSSAGHYGINESIAETVNETALSSPSRRGSAPISSLEDRTSSRRSSTHHSGNTSSSGNRHRSRSRPRDKSERSASEPVVSNGGGESSSGDRRAKSRSRHRSKSRGKSRPRERGGGGGRTGESSSGRGDDHGGGGESSQSQPGGAAREESLRDYWKRRAEESKDRVGSGPTTTTTSSTSVGAGSWGEKMDKDRGEKKPPPPPREGRRASSSHYSSSRARSKSRGRSERDRNDAARSDVGSTTASLNSSTTTPRKVDSIASALVGHARKSSGGSTSVTSPQKGGARSYASAVGQQTSSSSVGKRELASQELTNEIMNKQPTPSSSVVEDLSSLSPLHHSLATASWEKLYEHIQSLAKTTSAQSSTSTTTTGPNNNNSALSEIAATLSLPHPREGGTVLHVASWKAPPALAVMLMRLMPVGSREMSVLQSIRDGEGNTPLHLCCGNLDCRDSYEDDDDGKDDGNGKDKGESEGEVDHLAVLREIAQSAPSKAWTVQNSEGDTPLHMLVASPLCTSNWRANSHTSAELNERRAKLSAEAITLALSTADAIEACLMPERTGATPLHIALASGAHDVVIESLLAASPSAARAEDARGMTPLHWAAAFGRAGYGAVKKLVECYPQGLVAGTVDGDIPLHLAVSNAMMEDEATSNTSGAGVGGQKKSAEGGGDSTKVDKNRLKIVELLMHDHGSGRSSSKGSSSSVGERDVVTTTSPILTTNREKLTPLHCCALFDAPPQISKLLMKHPDANAASSMTNSFGATPLHLAAAQPGVSQSIATVLAIGSPDAAAVQDRLKRTPLHVAAQNTYATNLLIKTLAELNPNAASVKTQRGHLPLHLAAQSQAKEAVIRALIKAYPAAAEARNKSNNTPLHDAAKYRASLGVVRLLLDAYPGALYVQNQYGNLPLHCATAYQAPSDVVQLLLKSWPEGASMQNRNQDAPLHYAAAYATSAAAVRPLIEAAPAAVLLLNSSGQSPVDRARANNAPGDIVRLLESAAEEYSRNATSGDGSWASFGQGGSGGGGGAAQQSTTHASF